MDEGRRCGEDDCHFCLRTAAAGLFVGYKQPRRLYGMALFDLSFPGLTVHIVFSVTFLDKAQTLLLLVKIDPERSH